MGRVSRAAFGRWRLPHDCIVYAGLYTPRLERSVGDLFDKWQPTKWARTPYTFAKHAGREVMVVFNVYGAAQMLEVLHLLKDGGTEQVFFAGSMFAKKFPVGRLVIPKEVVDRAGIVSVDSPGREMIIVDGNAVDAVRAELSNLGLRFSEAKIVSVPCVLHNVENVKAFVRNNDDVDGVDMELSTFFYFTEKLGLSGYALVHVSDNEKYDVVSTAKRVSEAKRKAKRNMTRAILGLLQRNGGSAKAD